MKFITFTSAADTPGRIELNGINVALSRFATIAEPSPKYVRVPQIYTCPEVVSAIAAVPENDNLSTPVKNTPGAVVT